MKQLKPGCAPGVEGISPEHVKYGVNTVLPVLGPHLFTVCIQYGVVPESFSKGLLIPKPNIVPSTCMPKHYRPDTVSIILSKYLILEQCPSHKFSDSQHGFVAGRGCSMATVLAHDVGVYANASGSTVFYCSLDTEGAFDSLPPPGILSNSILFCSTTITGLQ